MITVKITDDSPFASPRFSNGRLMTARSKPVHHFKFTFSGLIIKFITSVINTFITSVTVKINYPNAMYTYSLK